jgi:hypothetical protein
VDVFNVVIRWFTPGTFHIVPGDDADVRREKLANFMAHCHFPGKAGGAVAGCTRRTPARLRQPDGRQGRPGVLAGRGRHVNYTLDAVGDLLPRRRR